VKHLYLVPVREGRAGTACLQTGQLSSGEPVGLAFTSEASILMTLGPSQHWIRLAPAALRALLEPLGITSIRVDPRPIAELVTQNRPSDPHAKPRRARRTAAPALG
jgi:hypothetical protein